MVTILDSFEDGDISEYSGDTGSFATATSTVYDGNNSLETSSDSVAILRDDVTITPSAESFGLWANLSRASTFVTEGGIVFGAPSVTGYGSLDGYVVAYLANYDYLYLYRYDNGSQTTLGNISSIGGSLDTYYRIAVTQWTDAGDITVELQDDTGSTLGSLSATDNTYSGGAWGVANIQGGSNSNHYDLVEKTEPSLSAPPNVHFNDTTTEDELTLDWDEDPNATGYYVYRAQASGSSTSDYTQVADVTSPPYTDTGLEDGEQYYYRVSSHD